MMDTKPTLLSLEEELTSAEQNALEEERSSVRHIFSLLEREIDDVWIPFPEVGRYDTGVDYNDISALQHMKGRNRKAWERIDAIQEYLNCSMKTGIFTGHCVLESGLDYYVMEHPSLPSKTLERNENIRLINVDDRYCYYLVDMWRNSQLYTEIQISRIIEMHNRQVDSVTITLDRSNPLVSGITDSFLRKTLIRNKDRVGIVSIIQTIQEKQDHIRLLPKDQSFIVQGCAGSGKTMVLLHRLRYLLYNRDIYDDEYLFLIQTKEFGNFVHDACEDFRIRPNNIVTVFSYFRKLASPKDGKIEEKSELVLPSPFLKRVYSKEFLQDACMEFIGEIERQMKNLSSFCKTSLEGSRELEDEVASLREILENFTDASQALLDECFDRLESLEPFADILLRNLRIGAKLYASIFPLCTLKEQKNLEKQCKLFSYRTERYSNNYISQQLFNACKRVIRSEYNVTISKSYKNYWYILLYCHYLSGSMNKSINDDSRRFVFIDEAQDLSASEIELIRKINTQSNSGRNAVAPVMNLFGDVNQMVTQHGIKDWSEIDFIRDVYTLCENFRNPDQIVDFCNNRFSFKMDKVGVELEPVCQYETITSAISNKDNFGDGWVYIAKDEYTKKDLVDLLCANGISDYIVYSVNEVKGLEFKRVCVFDEQMTDSEAYVSYTRALVELVVIRELPRFDKNHVASIEVDVDSESVNEDF